MDTILCVHCRKPFSPNPRIKNQRYCGKKDCQRARKTSWQKKKLKHDPDYAANQKDCQKSWRERHPGYWQNWREHHPEYTAIKRIRQKERNRRMRRPIAKMDASKPDTFVKSGWYLLIREPAAPETIAKMDASIQKIQLISYG